ncbi:hypothetical protein CRUP_017486, partial [Coryphaenoides rupestris]
MGRRGLSSQSAPGARGSLTGSEGGREGGREIGTPSTVHSTGGSGSKGSVSGGAAAVTAGRAAADATSDEGSTISCVIERTRGALDLVYVNYSVSELGPPGSQGPSAQQDFANATGAVLFMPGQRSETSVPPLAMKSSPGVAPPPTTAHSTVTRPMLPPRLSMTRGTVMAASSVTSRNTPKESPFIAMVTTALLGRPMEGRFLSATVWISMAKLSSISGSLSVRMGTERLAVARPSSRNPSLPGTARPPRSTSSAVAFRPYAAASAGGVTACTPPTPVQEVVQEHDGTGSPVVRENAWQDGSRRQAAAQASSGSRDEEASEMLNSLPPPVLARRLGHAHQVGLRGAVDHRHEAKAPAAGRMQKKKMEERKRGIGLTVGGGGRCVPRRMSLWLVQVLVRGCGVVKKTVEVEILEDSVPEDSESLLVGLAHTDGGSRILPSSDTVTIVILANDHVAGIVGFHPASRAVATREGEQLSLLVMRTAPGLGNVTVDWSVRGPLVDRTFAQTSGKLLFTQGELNDTIVLQLLDDATPEDKDEYRGAEAVVTIETSDEPFGMLSIAASSLHVTTEERDRTLSVYVNREFGTSGAVNITYEVLAGSLRDLSQVEGVLADADEDFVAVTGSVVLQPGQTSVAIPVTILDDDIPELEEFFLVNITSAVLITTLATAPRLDTTDLVAEISIAANDGIRGAQQGLDYNINQTMLHFVHGERHKFVEVQIIDDLTPEGPERFQLILSKPSPGLELGTNTTATVNILASDDGHGVLSFNGSERLVLREPTSSSAPSESVAMLTVVRSPHLGTVGTVTVQFAITDGNGSLAEGDLRPAQGSVVLENGVRFK